MINQTDLDVRLQLTGCEYGSMVNAYVNKLKFGSNCTFKDKANLFLINSYLNITSGYEVGNENNCYSEEELMDLWEQVSIIIGLCFQPYGFSYYGKCFAPTAKCKANLTVNVVLGPGGTVTVLATDVDNGSSDPAANQNPGIATYQISQDSINFFNSINYGCVNVGQTTPIWLKVTNNCGLTDTCETTITITDTGMICAP